MQYILHVMGIGWRLAGSPSGRLFSFVRPLCELSRAEGCQE